jgi:Protein of unknown function (DUF2568)
MMFRNAMEGESDRMTTTERVTLASRVLMEVGIVVALASWGYHTGGGTTARIVLAIAAPAIGFGLWGAVDFRRAGRLAEPLRLAEELVISGLAAAAWYAAGRHGLGIALAALSVLYHALVYASGARLLRPADSRPVRASGRQGGTDPA